MLARGSASLQRSGLGFAMAWAPLSRPEYAEWETEPLPLWRPWPSFCGDEPALPAFDSTIYADLDRPAQGRHAKQQRYRVRQQAIGRCPRCGGRRPCQRCRSYRRARWETKERARHGFQPWRPGSLGQRPLWVRHAVKMFQKVIIPAVAKMDCSDDDGARAAVVMWGGLWAHFDVELIAWITSYDRRFVQRCAKNLIANGVWDPKARTIACDWLNKELPAMNREVAFWCDSLVALGVATRTKDASGAFLFQARTDVPA